MTTARTTRSAQARGQQPPPDDSHSLHLPGSSAAMTGAARLPEHPGPAAPGQALPETWAPWLLAGDPPRIALYVDATAPPQVFAPSQELLSQQESPADLIAWLTRTSYELASQQGGQLPLPVFRELVENLVHADFRRVVISILDHGNTLRVSDGGPGIPDKEAALRPGFTSASSRAKRLVRGVGAGLPVVQEIVAALGGTLKIEDNLGGGTVITVRLLPGEKISLAPSAPPSYNLSQRQLKTLLLVMELAPVGPSRIAHELHVATSTAYRDLVHLEELGLVSAAGLGRRVLTEAGLAYLDALV